ncbi:MAG: iron ABC transporter permease [Actinomycetota bacterium]
MPALPATVRARPLPGVRLLTVAVGLLALIVALSVYNLASGETTATWSQVTRALFDAEAARTQDPTLTLFIRDLRLPRILAAVIGGASLGVAGVILQDSLRNPLADPGLLGLLQVASFVVAVAAIYPEVLVGIPLNVLILAAQVVAGIIVLSVVGRIRGPVRIVLIGAALTAFFATMSTLVILLAPFQRTTGITAFNRYVIGSLAAITWGDVTSMAPWLVVAVPLALLGGRALNLLQLGDEMALAGGLNPQRARIALLVLAMALTAPVVANVGPVAFIALLAPHVARGLLTSSEARRVMVVSSLLGAFFLLAADTLGRLLFFPFEVPAGVWTVLLIGPMAIWLVGRRRTAAVTA